MTKLMGDDLVQKIAFILIAKNLNRLKPKEVFETKIKACMGEKCLKYLF